MATPPPVPELVVAWFPEMVQLIKLAVAPLTLSIAPPTTPELLLNVLSVTVSVPALRIAPPPAPIDWLLTNVQPLTVRAFPAWTSMPPNRLVESLPLVIVTPVIVAVAALVTSKTPVWLPANWPLRAMALSVGLAVIVTFVDITNGPFAVVSELVPLRPDWNRIVSLLPNVPLTWPVAGPP